MGKPSTCAFRCFYDSENDVCGPSHFCEKVGSSPADTLAPFGAEQKCRAVGAADHDAADLAIANKLEDIKREVLDLTERLEQSPAISEKQSSRSSLKASAAMFQEASQILDLMEATPARLAPDSGNFARAAARTAYTDMKHWRGRQDRLTIPQYKRAARASIAEVRDSQDLSVPAKLHSTLVDYVKKHPNMIIQFLKQETDEKCSLSDETDEQRAQLETFVDYVLTVPGHDINDLKDVNHGIPKACRDFLVREEETDVQTLIKTAEEGHQLLSNSTSAGDTADGLIQVKSERLARAIGSDRISLLDTSDLADESERSERVQFVGFVFACVFICIILILATIGFWHAGTRLFDSHNSKCGWNDKLTCVGAFLCFAMGGLCIWGAFAFLLPVGIVTLVVAIIGTAMVSLAEISEHKSVNTMPDWKAISHLAM